MGCYRAVLTGLATAEYLSKASGGKCGKLVAGRIYLTLNKEGEMVNWLNGCTMCNEVAVIVRLFNRSDHLRDDRK